MKNKHGDKVISKLGEFYDRGLEDKFYENYIKRSIKSIKNTILNYGILYMIFSVLDILIVTDHSRLLNICILRAVLFVSAFAVYKIIGIIKEYNKIENVIDFCVAFGCADYLIISIQYANPNFFAQSFGVMAIIICIFILPGRLKNSILTTSAFSILFFIIYYSLNKNVRVQDFLICMSFVAFVFFLSMFSAAKINYYKRTQFLYTIKLIDISVRDRLTGIYNRFKFDEVLRKNINDRLTYGTPFSMIIFDYDNFKFINDKYGHLVGDKVIITVTNMVKKCIAPNDLFFRWGGEEFIVLFPDTRKWEVFLKIDKIRNKISKIKFDEGCRITCSFGVTSYEEGDDAESIMKRVDKLLYEAKARGKNKVIM